MPVIRQAVPRLIRLLDKTGHTRAAQAIMTTDTRHKEIARRTTIGQRVVTMGGMAKGSGMIHPNMATLLACLTTDAVIAPRALQSALTQAVRHTFNCISIDGDTSTNDTVLCLANGRAGNPPIQIGTPQWKKFYALLYEACLSLSSQICRDGEGCTKVVEIIIRGTKTNHAAKDPSHKPLRRRFWSKPLYSAKIPTGAESWPRPGEPESDFSLPSCRYNSMTYPSSKTAKALEAEPTGGLNGSCGKRNTP